MKNNITKLLCAVLCMVIVFGSTTFAQAAQAPYSEIQGHWAESDMGDWINKGLIKGYANGSYKPNSNITRSEFVALVNRAYGLTEKAEISFTDLKENDWAYEEIAKAKAAGYIEGFVDGTFRGSSIISRQEAAVIISRIQKLDNAENADILKQFTDEAAIPAWSKNAISAVVSKGYMVGMPDKSYKAAKLITRAEAVTVLNRSTTKDDGQAVDNKELFEAIRKTMAVNSMENDGSLGFRLSASNLSNEDKEALEPIIPMVNSTTINYSVKADQNDAKTASKAYANAVINFAGLDIDTSLWADFDFTGEIAKINEIVKLPEMLSGMLPENLAGKEYMIFDYDMIKNNPELQGQFTAADYKEMMNMSGQYQETLINFIEDYTSQTDNKSLIKDMKSRVVNTPSGQEIAHVYQIKIDDAAFKAFLAATAKDPSLDKELAAELAKFVDSIKDIQIIGDKGIVMNYAIGKESYIINKKGNIDIRIDAKALSKLMGDSLNTSETQNVSGIYNIGIDFNNNSYNFNKDIDITLPTVNSNNSFKLTDLFGDIQ